MLCLILAPLRVTTFLALGSVRFSPRISPGATISAGAFSPDAADVFCQLPLNGCLLGIRAAMNAKRQTD
jgi:hypothetical protein